MSTADVDALVAATLEKTAVDKRIHACRAPPPGVIRPMFRNSLAKAEIGFHTSMMYVAGAYMMGHDGVAKNQARALAWWWKAALHPANAALASRKRLSLPGFRRGLRIGGAHTQVRAP